MGNVLSSADPLESRLAGLISERILDAKIEADSNLYDAGLDSLAIMQLLLVIEEEFQVVIPVESVSRANFTSVQTIAQLLREKDVAVGETSSAPDEEAGAAAASTPPTADDGSLATMGGCDYFTVCFDAWSRKTGQGGHKAHSFLVLDSAPDVGKLRAVLDAAAENYPLLFSRLRRKGWFGNFRWLKPETVPPVPLACWAEEGAPGRLANASRCASAMAKAEEIVNTPLPLAISSGGPHVRFNVIERRDGAVMLILSWSHLLMDGVGAEFFLTDLARLAGDVSSAPIPLLSAKEPPPIDWKEAWDRAMPMIRYFNTLVAKSFDCLGPRKPRAGRTRFEVHTLTEEQTRRVRARCSELCGELVSMPFFLACAARAHDRVFAERGLSPKSHVCSVPVQTRRKGGRGPIFLNHITMFFGALSREELGRLEDAVASLVAQHAAFLRNQLGEGLDRLMRMMSVMPPLLYMRFIMLHMRGPFASFFHSHTGEFAPGLDRFFGAAVANAFHVPGIATPPGDGIFCNEKNGRLVVTLSWHEGSLSEAERGLMLDHFLADLGAA